MLDFIMHYCVFLFLGFCYLALVIWTIFEPKN